MSNSQNQKPHSVVATPPEETPHFSHQIHLDRWKIRNVRVMAPSVVTQAEMDRIKGWIGTIFIVEEEIR